jgi:hypothetical protein
MEAALLQRFGLGRVANSRVAFAQRRMQRKGVPVRPVASLQPSDRGSQSPSSMRSKFKVVAGPAGPVSCSSLPKGSKPWRLMQSVRLHSQLRVVQAAGPRPISSAVLPPRLSQSGSNSMLAVAWYSPRPAAWPPQRPNPSVKGTSRKRAAPYVERSALSEQLERR